MGMLPPYSYREGDVWFRGPLLESVDDKGQVVFSPEVGEVGGGCGPVGAGTPVAHCRSARCAREGKKGEGRSKERAVAEPKHLSSRERRLKFANATSLNREIQRAGCVFTRIG